LLEDELEDEVDRAEGDSIPSSSPYCGIWGQQRLQGHRQ